MFNPSSILGLTKNADINEIKKAYRQRAMQCHPDKGGSIEEMQDLNRAFKILTDENERAKWENSVEAQEHHVWAPQHKLQLPSTSERRSEPFRRFFQAMETLFTEHPLLPIMAKKRNDTLIANQFLQDDYFQHLYRIKEDALEYNDVFEFVSHKTKWSNKQASIEPSFFQKKLSITVALDILLAFLQGNYHGKTLENIQHYLIKQTDDLYQINNHEVIFYRSIISIISAQNFSKEYQEILKAIEGIYTSSTKGNIDIVRLIQDKHFRYLVACALTHYWQDEKPVTAENMLRQIRNNPANLTPLGKLILQIEKRVTQSCSGDTSLDAIYESAYVMIDLMTCMPSVYRLNCHLFAALCFQHAAKIETDAPRAMAAERLALDLYQMAIQGAFELDAITAVYVSTHAVKALSGFIYDQSTFNLKEINKYLLQPGDAAVTKSSGSVLSTMQGTIKRVLYFIDMAPFYINLTSSIDWGSTHTFQLGLMRKSLHALLSQNPLIDHAYTKVIYHAYDEAISNAWDEAVDEENNRLKMQAIHALLEECGSDIYDMATFIDSPYIHMQRDDEGWILPTNELDFPEKAGVAVYQSFDGYEIDTDTGDIQFIYKEWKKGDRKSSRLFSEFDIFQMITKGISGGFLSLDHPDANKKYHPLQTVRFSPENLEGTEYLKTLFMTDYLLKMFTTGAEISGRPPYLTRSTDKLLARLPTHLRDALNRCCDNESKNRAHRFWITAGDIETQTVINGTKTRVYFGHMAMSVQKHLLEYNAEGDLVDAKVDRDDDSKEAEFAKLFTQFYDEIATYFPEFQRLKELVKIAGAIRNLRYVFENNERLILSHTLLLADTSYWQNTLKERAPEHIAHLNEAYKSLPEIIRNSRNLSNTTWWSGQFNTRYQQKITLLQNACKDFPKFVFQLYDSEITAAYNQRYTENYNRIYTQIYNDTYKKNEDHFTAKYGIAIWNSEKARLSGEISTDATQSTKKILAAQLTQQSILDSYNRQASTARAAIRQSFYTQLSSLKSRVSEAVYSAAIDAFLNKNCVPLAQLLAQEEIDDHKAIYTKFRQRNHDALPELPKSLGVAYYSTLIDKFMDGDVEPLAQAIAQQEVNSTQVHIKSELDKKQHLHHKFQAMLFESDVSTDKKEAHAFRVPAVFHRHTNRRVYGGVSAFPSFREVTSLSNNLASPFTSLKEFAIREAEDFIRRARSLSCVFLLSGSAFAEAYSDIRHLERSIDSAKSELFWLKTEENRRQMSFFRDVNNKENSFVNRALKVAATPPVNGVWAVDPFLSFRLESDLNRQLKAANLLRELATPTIQTVVNYTQALLTGTVQGIGDIGSVLLHPYENCLKPAGQLLFDAAVIASAHIFQPTLESIMFGQDDFLLLKALISRHADLYENAKHNMLLRIDNIRNGVDSYFRALA